ncbi:MAG: aminotransferase class I/II-fold pyridoxal phosphate-dependent enzyme [Rickettsiales bacterium]|jgi:cobalamin biosynthetic protein CobC
MSDNIDNVVSQHGGNLSLIAQHFPDAPRPFIDLSTGINPYSYPLVSVEGAVQRLADVTEMERLRKSAAIYYGADEENINLSAGMQPLMFALAALRLQKFGVAKVVILSPTYSEYEKILLAAGHEVLQVETFEELTQGDVAIICNPNNPDGKIYSPEQIKTLKNNWVIIDESFADLAPSLTNDYQALTTIKMRSCGKFFGIAGLRVSSVIAPKEISAWLRVVVGSWPITTDACLALPEMFENKAWIEQMRERLRQESAIWREFLAKYFVIIGYTSLFTLVETENVEFWHEKLAKNGILIRKFAYNKQWLRFGLPNCKDLERVKNAFMKDKI